MRLVYSLPAFLAFALSVHGLPVTKRSIDGSLFNDLEFYFKYAASAYSDSCASPNGNTLVKMITNSITDTQGFIARDDSRKEIIVSLRGSSDAQDYLTDAGILFADLISPGISAPSGTSVHSGFLIAWNSVAANVISLVSDQLASNPGYSIVTTGHSLGGALSSLAGISLQQNFPDISIHMYTYGQPRTGDKDYANFINDKFGSNASRVTHTNDGVPTMIPTFLGYLHHGIEYWLNADPPSAANTTQCAASGEDPTCSASIPSAGIDAAHNTYFGYPVLTPFCS